MDLSKFTMRTTPTHVYFWGGPFSQWWLKSKFTAELPVFRPVEEGRDNRLVRSGVPFVFSSCEKYMMASKASVFGDVHKGGTLEKILGTAVLFGETDEKAPGFCVPMHDVKAIKAVGRTVPGLNGGEWDADDVKLWDRASVPAVTIGNISKFSQNDDIHAVMVAMGDRTYVEGSRYDDIWGVKLSWDDPKIEDERNWKGKNKLGKVLDVTSRIVLSLPREIDAWQALARYHRPAPTVETAAPSP